MNYHSLHDYYIAKLTSHHGFLTFQDLLFRAYNLDALCDLVPFLQFKKREKHPWRSITISKVAGWFCKDLLKILSNKDWSCVFDFCCNQMILHNLLPFVLFKKREKHPWRSVTFSKVTGFCAKHHSYSSWEHELIWGILTHAYEVGDAISLVSTTSSKLTKKTFIFDFEQIIVLWKTSRLKCLECYENFC